MAGTTRSLVERIARKRYWREADGRLIVGEWRRSGETISGFARRHGVRRDRVARWVARLRGPDEEVRFLPVRVVGSQEPPCETKQRAPIEIELPGDRRVIVPAGFAMEDLRRVLRALEGSLSC
jgi:transposase-like protein